MNSERKPTYLSAILCVFACLAIPPGAHGQQPASSAHFGASVSGTGSGSGASMAVRGAGTGGGSIWGAGKGSFGHPAQPGGVWRDRTTLPATSVAGQGAAQAGSHAMRSPSSEGALPPESFHAKQTGIHGNGALRTTRISPAASGQRSGISVSSSESVSGPSGLRHTATGSRGRVTSLGLGASRKPKRPSSGFDSSLTQREIGNRPATGFSPREGLNTGLSKPNTRLLP
jgi:hypothetical protein